MAMKRTVVLLGVVLSMTLLVGCSKKSEPTNNTTQTSTNTSQSMSSTNEANASNENTKETDTHLFDALSNETKIVLYTDIVDERVAEFPGLEQFALSYYQEGNDIYLLLNGGAGRVQTVFHLLSSDEGIQPIQTIGYDTANGHADASLNGNTKFVSKDTLYQTYTDRKADFDKAVGSVKKDRNIYLNFVDGLRKTGAPMESADSKLTNEELVVAAYIKNHIQEGQGDTIPIYMTNLLNKALLKLNKTDNGYSVDGIQQTVKDDYQIKGDKIISTISPSDFTYNNGQSTNTLSLSTLQSEFQSYKGMLTLLTNYIKISEELDNRNKKESLEKQQVNTSNLTEDQAISWVKNYLKSNGATEEELADAGFKTILSDEGYLTIEMFTWTPTHNDRTLAYIYRVNGDGYLQEGNIANTDSWNTISTSYIE
ncbi:hypothetical protein [Enterococcus faecalis]|uniref:hypothetical protein n=1 Tax=Enterococcus faecalis TaxID=1351 RepID=UPI0029389B5C|nr:hypothetical protein [Enterococcus faecalis]